MASGKTGEREDRGGATPLLEWLGAAAGSLVAVALLGSLAYEALTTADAPPRLSIVVLSQTGAPDGAEAEERVVPFRVVNSGGRTAAEVTVAARVPSSAGEPFEAEVVFDFVPRGSEREGAVVLPEGADGPVTLRVTGYREP
jgi:uncharacterized protein (TIGR02588 family)